MFPLKLNRLRITRKHVLQATVIFIVVMMSWGKRMGSSLLSPLKSTLKQELDIDNTQWASVISMVWVVGTVSPFIAGLLIDTMGEPLAGALAILLILLGNGVCALAVGSKKLSIFLLGRAIYSTGGGAVLLVGEVIMFKWFKERQLPIAFGCASTIGGLMSFSGPATVTAILKRHANITIPFWLATGLSALGLICFGGYALIHYSRYGREIEDVSKNDENHSGDVTRRASEEDLCQQDTKTTNGFRHDSEILSEKAHVSHTHHNESGTPESEKCSPAELLSVTMPVTNPFKRAWLKTCALVHNLARLPETYWHILLCITVQGTLFIPLHEVIPEMMETEWGYTRAQSSQLFVYLHIIPIVLHLSLGIFINRIGHRLTLFLVGSVLVFLAALFITFIRQVPIMVSLIMMNFSGSFVPAAIFSMMNLVIDNGEVAGAALGLIRSAEFASVTLMEMLDGLLQDADHNRYDTVLIGLFVFAAILLAVAVASIIMDAKLNGGLLNSANPYKRSSSSPSPSPSPSTDNMLTSADRTDTKVTFYSDTQFQDSSSGIAEAEPRVPVRRYIYLAAIGVVLGMAWISFILSLTRT